MKKVLVVLLLSCANSAYAQAPSRTVEKDYTFIEPRYGPGELGARGVSEFRFKPQAGERWVSISVEDDFVGPVPGFVYQFPAISYPFCGSTSKPVPIVPRRRVVVELGRGSCEPPPNFWGTGTHIAGTVTATFDR